MRDLVIRAGFVFINQLSSKLIQRCIRNPSFGSTIIPHSDSGREVRESGGRAEREMGRGTIHTHPISPDQLLPSSSPCLNNLPVPSNQATPHGGSYYPISSCSNDAVFDAVPSPHEIEKALASLLDLLNGMSSSGSNLVWLQYPRIPSFSGLKRFTDALHLLQTELSFKTLVISLCCDKALWVAIMNNVAVQRLRQALHTGDKERLGFPNETELGISSLSWILDIIKEKIMELSENFKLLVNKMFQPSQNSPPVVENAEHWEEKVQSSLLLSVVILLIVVLARVHGV